MAKLIYTLSFFIFAYSCGSHSFVTHGGEDYDWATATGKDSPYKSGSAGNSGYWWSASEINSANAFRRGVYYDSDSSGYYSYGMALLLSVRCLRN